MQRSTTEINDEGVNYKGSLQSQGPDSNNKREVFSASFGKPFTYLPNVSAIQKQPVRSSSLNITSNRNTLQGGNSFRSKAQCDIKKKPPVPPRDETTCLTTVSKPSDVIISSNACHEQYKKTNAGSIPIRNTQENHSTNNSKQMLTFDRKIDHKGNTTVSFGESTLTLSSAIADQPRSLPSEKDFVLAEDAFGCQLANGMKRMSVVESVKHSTVHLPLKKSNSFNSGSEAATLNDKANAKKRLDTYWKSWQTRKTGNNLISDKPVCGEDMNGQKGKEELKPQYTATCSSFNRSPARTCQRNLQMYGAKGTLPGRRLSFNALSTNDNENNQVDTNELCTDFTHNVTGKAIPLPFGYTLTPSIKECCNSCTSQVTSNANSNGRLSWTPSSQVKPADSGKYQHCEERCKKHSKRCSSEDGRAPKYHYYQKSMETQRSPHGYYTISRYGSSLQKNSTKRSQDTGTAVFREIHFKSPSAEDIILQPCRCKCHAQNCPYQCPISNESNSTGCGYEDSEIADDAYNKNSLKSSCDCDELTRKNSVGKSHRVTFACKEQIHTIEPDEKFPVSSMVKDTIYKKALKFRSYFSGNESDSPNTSSLEEDPSSPKYNSQVS